MVLVKKQLLRICIVDSVAYVAGQGYRCLESTLGQLVDSVDSSLCVVRCCFRQSAQLHSSILPFRFGFRNIRYCIETFFSDCESCDATGFSTARPCSCFISAWTVSPPFPNRSMPGFLLNWVMAKNTKNQLSGFDTRVNSRDLSQS